MPIAMQAVIAATIATLAAYLLVELLYHLNGAYLWWRSLAWTLGWVGVTGMALGGITAAAHVLESGDQPLIAARYLNRAVFIGGVLIGMLMIGATHQRELEGPADHGMAGVIVAIGLGAGLYGVG